MPKNTMLIIVIKNGFIVNSFIWLFEHCTIVNSILSRFNDASYLSE